MRPLKSEAAAFGLASRVLRAFTAPVLDIDTAGAFYRDQLVVHCGLRNELVAGNGGMQVLLEDPSGNPVELFEPR